MAVVNDAVISMSVRMSLSPWFLVLWGIYPEAELLDHVVILVNF